jgi:hypothetical protein
MEKDNKNSVDTSSEQKLGVEDQLDKQSKALRNKKNDGPQRKYLDISFSWPMLIIIGLATYGIAYAVGKTTVVSTSSILWFIVISYAIALFVYNLGKIIFGYIAGYKFSLIEILGFQFNFSGKKMKFRFILKNIFELHLKLMPKRVDANPMIMLFGGSIFYIFVVIILIVLAPIFGSSDSETYIYYGCALGALVVFYEMLPVKLDVFNDMYYIILISQEKGKTMFNKLLLAEASERSGEFVEDFELDSVKNSRLKPETLLYKLRKQVLDKNYKDAIKTVEEINYYSLYLSDQTKVETLYEQMYVYLDQGYSREAEKLILLLEKKVKNSADLFATPYAARTEILMAGLVDNSLEQVLVKRNAFIQSCRYFGPTECVQKNIELARKGIVKIKLAHPSWKVYDLPENLFKVNKKEDDEI